MGRGDTFRYKDSHVLRVVFLIPNGMYPLDCTCDSASVILFWASSVAALPSDSRSLASLSLRRPSSSETCPRSLEASSWKGEQAERGLSKAGLAR